MTGTELDRSSTLDMDDSTYIPALELKINIPRGGKIIGSYCKAEIEAKINLIKEVLFGLGYKTTGFNVEDDDTFEANLEMKDFYLFAAMEF